MDFPKRIVFFCECGARFDSHQSLKPHADACQVAQVLGLRREKTITLIELALGSVFEKLPGGRDYFDLLLTLARFEVTRQKEPARVWSIPAENFYSGDGFQIEANEGGAAMAEVASWYGISVADLMASSPDERTVTAAPRLRQEGDQHQADDGDQHDDNEDDGQTVH